MEAERAKARIAEGSEVPRPVSPAEFGKFMRDDAGKWREMIEFAGFGSVSRRALVCNAGPAM
jgi:hypothetical protein